MSFRPTIKTMSRPTSLGVILGTRLSDDGQSSPDGTGDVAVQPVDPELKKPSLFRVVLMNDDFTPMEFVVHILEQFFAMNREKVSTLREPWRSWTNALYKGRGPRFGLCLARKLLCYQAYSQMQIRCYYASPKY